MVVPSRQSSSDLDPQYTVLAIQLGDIETLIDGIENCMTASVSTFASMAPAVLHELELLKGATAQIRKNGATLILAEAGRPLTEVRCSVWCLCVGKELCEFLTCASCRIACVARARLSTRFGDS